MQAGDRIIEVVSGAHPSLTKRQGQTTLKPTHKRFSAALMENVIIKWADEFGSDKWGTWRSLCIFDSDLIHLAGVDVD